MSIPPWASGDSECLVAFVVCELWRLGSGDEDHTGYYKHSTQDQTQRYFF